MENKNLEIEKYEVIDPMSEDNLTQIIEYHVAEELDVECNNSSHDFLLRITYCEVNEDGKKSYKITKKFALLLENKTIYTLVAGPINGLFVLKVTQPNGACFFQVVDASGFVKQDNLTTYEEALRCINKMVSKVAPARSSGLTLG